MSDPLLDRQVRRRLAVLRHVEEVTGNVAMTCRYFGISRQLYYTWLRRYRADGLEGLRDRSCRPKVRHTFGDVMVAMGHAGVGRPTRAMTARSGTPRTRSTVAAARLGC